MKVPFNTKLSEEQLKCLRELSEETHIPMAKLIELSLIDLFKKYGKEIK